MTAIYRALAMHVVLTHPNLRVFCGTDGMQSVEDAAEQIAQRIEGFAGTDAVGDVSIYAVGRREPVGFAQSAGDARQHMPTDGIRRVVIEDPAGRPGIRSWSVRLYDGASRYPREIYACSSAENAGAVAAIVLEGRDPPPNYYSLSPEDLRLAVR